MNSRYNCSQRLGHHASITWFGRWAAFGCILLALSLIACGGGGGGGSGSDGGSGSSGDDDDDGGGGGGGRGGSGEEAAPTAVTVHPGGHIIAQSGSIVLLFSESMDPDTISLGGDLSGENGDLVWSDTSESNDRLTIPPDSFWSTGSGRSLSISGNDLDGDPLSNVLFDFDVYEGVVYVRPNGNDLNAGTDPDAPKASIASAIAKADELYDQSAVLLSAGFFYVAAPIELVDGVSIVGGFKGGDWTEQDPFAYVTTVVSSIVAGTDTVIHGDGDIGAATLVEGLAIQGGQIGTTTMGVLLEGGASPTIRNNTIHGGLGATNSYGMRLIDAGTDPLVEGNSVFGGTHSGGTSRGLDISAASPQVLGNFIHGGSSANTYGIDVSTGGEPTIENNTIISRGGSAYGLRAFGSAPDILNNLISATATTNGNDATALSILNLSNPLIEGNSLLSQTTTPTTGVGYGIRVQTNSLPEITANTIIVTSAQTGFGIDTTGASPEITNNAITVTGINTTPYGIFTSAASTNPISGNTIAVESLGAVTGTARGIFMQAASGDITGNTIAAGDAESNSYGIVTGGAVTISGNMITSGTVQSGSSQGINVSGGTTTISGNTIVGGTGVSSAFGIVSTSSSTISGNVVTAGASSATSAGIHIAGGTTTISGNTVQSGDGVNSYALELGSGTLTITGNTLISGDGSTSSHGVQVSTASTIRNNVILGGSAGTVSRGIYVGGSAIVENNTIYGGHGDTVAYGISVANGFAPTVQNNILFTGSSVTRICMEEGSVTADPAKFRNNVLFQCPTALYREENSTNRTALSDSISTGEGTSTLSNYGNVIDVPVFADEGSGDYRLAGSTPVNVRQGGLDLSGSFTTDKDGVARTAVTSGSPTNTGAAGWSMGAYEN